jgi:hypothetical protein
MESAKVRECGGVISPTRRFTRKRKAEFLLSAAATPADYRRVRRAVANMGLDPDAILNRESTRRAR